MGVSDLYSFFDRVYVINLERRKDRWNRFLKSLPASWPFGPPVRFQAIDGEEFQPPIYWSENRGAWGCYCSHLAVHGHALESGFERILILEDDAVFCRGFGPEVSAFLSRLPDDWELAYLGGQHIELHLGRPVQINELVYAPFNANRLHAYAIQSTSALQRIYDFLVDARNWTPLHHVDHFLGAYQKTYRSGVYTPAQWLVAQDCGTSDISLDEVSLRAFLGAQDIVHPKLVLPLVAVMGAHAKGASTVAGVLHQLGIPMGRSFRGSLGSGVSHGHEATELATMCESMFALPHLVETTSKQHRIELLKIWAAGHTKTFVGSHKMVGGMHPLFSLLGADLIEAWGEPSFICVESDALEMAEAMVARFPDWSVSRCVAVARHLIDAQETFLRASDARVLRLPQSALCGSGRKMVQQVCEFLNFEATREAFEQAVALVSE